MSQVLLEIRIELIIFNVREFVIKSVKHSKDIAKALIAMFLAFAGS